MVTVSRVRGFCRWGCPNFENSEKKVLIFCILYLLFSKNKTKLELAFGRAWTLGGWSFMFQIMVTDS